MIRSISASGAEAPAVIARERTPSSGLQSMSRASATSWAVRPSRSATSRRRCELEELAPDDDHRLDFARRRFYRLLAVGGRVANIFHRGGMDRRESAA